MQDSPTVPHYFPKTPRKKPPGPSANALTRAILHLITIEGGFATRINSQGQFDPVRRIMRRGTTVPGMTDIVGVYKGFPLFIEVKAGRDQLSLNQLDVQKRVEKAGGKWFCARDFDVFLKWFKALSLVLLFISCTHYRQPQHAQQWTAKDQRIGRQFTFGAFTFRAYLSSNFGANR